MRTLLVLCLAVAITAVHAAAAHPRRLTQDIGKDEQDAYHHQHDAIYRIFLLHHWSVNAGSSIVQSAQAAECTCSATVHNH
jgi:hypothetical protein